MLFPHISEYSVLTCLLEEDLLFFAPSPPDSGEKGHMVKSANCNWLIPHSHCGLEIHHIISAFTYAKMPSGYYDNFHKQVVCCILTHNQLLWHVSLCIAFVEIPEVLFCITYGFTVNKTKKPKLKTGTALGNQRWRNVVPTRLQMRQQAAVSASAGRVNCRSH